MISIVFVSLLDVLGMFGDSQHTLMIFDAYPVHLFQWLIVDIVDVSTCLHDFFSIHLNPRCFHLVPPLNCWVVQMPAREKSSKWKYKEDEGGKKDAEKEKTRSREQENESRSPIAGL